MNDKGDLLLCWCCEQFLVRFDNNITPNKITGGVCTYKRKECEPYDEICSEFLLKNELLPEYKLSINSIEERKKRNLNFIYSDVNLSK